MDSPLTLPRSTAALPPADRASATPLGRIVHLDGLRGVAVALVIVHHFLPPLLGNVPGSAGGYATAALTLAFSGVDLFFVLSGYLIGGILLDHRSSEKLIGTFYLKRSLRILPLAVASIAVMLTAYAAGLYSVTTEREPWSPVVYALFSVNLWMAATADWGFRPLAPLWSLAIEEQFYLISPWIIRAVRPRRLFWVFVAFVVIAPLSRWAILAIDPQRTLTASVLPMCRTDGLGLGMVAAWLMRAPQFDQTRARRVLACLALLSGVGCVWLVRARATNGGFTMAAGGYTIVALFFASVLLMTEVQRNGLLARIFSWPPLPWLGRISYCLYLFQGFAISLTVGVVFHGHLKLAPPTTWLQLATGVVALLVLAQASWRYVEAPLIALGRRAPY